MDVTSEMVCLSDLDQMRFGARTAKANQITAKTLPAVIDFCHAHQVEFLIARALTTDLATAQALESAGFLLMDTLVVYARDLKKRPIPPDDGQLLIRPIQAGEEADVKRVCEQSFGGYGGHYHADPKLDPEKCDQTYVDWATRSCVDREVAHEVLVADDDGAIVGFATLRLNHADEGEGVLFGVAPAAQGRGVYRSFMIHAMEWVRRQGATNMIVSTQITNVAVQKAWTRLGFEPNRSYYTFHKWFEGP